MGLNRLKATHYRGASGVRVVIKQHRAKLGIIGAGIVEDIVLEDPQIGIIVTKMNATAVKQIVDEGHVGGIGIVVLDRHAHSVEETVSDKQGRSIPED